MINKKNVQEWVKLIDVDWLGQYAKAWIAFNAWYRNYLGSRNSSGNDRAIIQKLKSGKKEICSTIAIFFMRAGTESKAFQSNIAELQSLLALTGIKSGGREISFETIVDYEHAKTINETIDDTIYEIKVDIEKPDRSIVVKDISGENIFCGTIALKAESVDQDEDWFKSVFAQTTHSLSVSQQETLIAFLKESSPIHNLLTGTENDCIKIENFPFVNDQNLIARALIEILYQLRNTLFHGEITPTPEIQEVYEPAYLILKRVILLVANIPTKQKK